MITSGLVVDKSAYIVNLFAAFSRIQFDDTTSCQSDSNNISAILNGNGDAFAELIRRYQNIITAKMWRFTRDKRQLEELVQDVFVEAYGSLRSFRQDSPFLPWLTKIAVRVGYRHWKKVATTSKEVYLDELDEIIADNKEIKPSRAAEILHDLLDKLPSKDRLVLMLMYFERCSVSEIAELTGWSRIMVKVRLHRARGKLKSLIGSKITL